MSTSSSSRRRRLGSSGSFVGACSVTSTQGSRQPSDRITVIAIDDQSIANIGRWPWPRDMQAQLIDKLAAAKAKTIVNTTLFLEPQTDRCLVFIRKLREALGEPGPNEADSTLLADAEQTLDTDAKLAASMVSAGNVLTPSVFAFGDPRGKPDKELPPAVARDSVDDREARATKVVILGATAQGIATDFPVPDLRVFRKDLRQAMALRGGFPHARAASDSAAPLSLASAARAHAEVEKMLATVAASTAPQDGWPAATSYDPPAKAAAADDAFAKTAVFGRPHGPAHPAGGGGQSGSEA